MSSAELADIRADFESEFLSQVAEIWRQEPGDTDSYGGQKFRYQKGKTVRCMLQAATRPQRTEEGKQNTPLADWEVLVPVGTVLEMPDQLHIDGIVYEVRGSDSATHGNPLLKVYVTRKDK